MLYALVLTAAAQQPPDTPPPDPAPPPIAAAATGPDWQQIGAVIGTVIVGILSAAGAGMAGRRFGTNLTGTPGGDVERVTTLERSVANLVAELAELRAERAERAAAVDTRIAAIDLKSSSATSAFAVLDERTRVDRREVRQLRYLVHWHGQNLIIVNDRLKLDPPSLPPPPEEDDSDEPPPPSSDRRKAPVRRRT